MGNRQTHAVLEVTIPGPEIEFLDQMVIAITGGELRPLFTKEGTRAEHSRPEIC